MRTCLGKLPTYMPGLIGRTLKGDTCSAVIDETRAELERLLQQNPDETNVASGSQPEPAD